MDESESTGNGDELDILRLRASAEAEVCPSCGRQIVEAGHGSGRLDDGLFCSLDCFAEFHYGPGGKGGTK